MVRRNLVSHEQLRAAGRIRRYFVEINPEIARYLYYGPHDDKPIRKKNWRDLASVGTGGLVETFMITNALIAAVLAVMISMYLHTRPNSLPLVGDNFPGSYLLMGIAGFLFAWTLQFIFVKLRYDEGRPKMSEIKYPTEVEAAFLVISDRPRDFVDRMEKLPSLGKYELQSSKNEKIRDLYFDTPEHALQALRIALRIREVDGKRFLTLKGPSSSIASGGVERLEPSFGDPTAVMSRHQNLSLVQERETERTIRNVAHKIGDDHLVVAEMAIDAVKYLFADIDSPIRIYQIEIEEKAWGSHSIMGELADEFEDKFKSEIRRWNYGKLATGKAIKKLLGECDRKKIVDADDNLRPAVYDWIENYIRKKDKNMPNELIG